jgi:hypothetical protein
MKVYIGPYRNWFGPYQLAEKLCFWAKPVKDEYDITERKPDWVHNFGEWLAHGSVEPDAKTGDITSWNIERHDTLLSKFLSWVHSKQERKIKVRIDRYDTWSMDHTLSYIILPMLKQLHETKHGAPFVDDKDVPKELRSTAAKPLTQEEKDCGHTDELHFKRWDWVLNEMIFAFESQHNDWEDQFQSGEHDIQWKKLENGHSQMLHGPKDTFKIDMKGRNAYQKRISNGYRLFGRYYENLWD